MNIKRHRYFPGDSYGQNSMLCGSTQLSNDSVVIQWLFINEYSLLIICRNIFLMSAVISDNNVTTVIVKDSLLYCFMTAFHVW